MVSPSTGVPNDISAVATITYLRLVLQLRLPLVLQMIFVFTVQLRCGCIAEFKLSNHDYVGWLYHWNKPPYEMKTRSPHNNGITLKKLVV